MDTTITGIGAVVVAGLRSAGYMESTVGQYEKTIRALIPLPIITRLLGHENASTTAAFYAFATIDMMRAAVNAATPAIDIPAENHLTQDKLQAL